ncbi:MAG: hypothetical protein WB709_06955 [Solirubrobacteraceae bacterium]
MFSGIRRRLTFTNAALILVLVFVMTGGAYAAKKYLITSTKQISPTVLKQLQGKAGPAGAPGAQGPAGAAGPAGANGKGEKGDKGENGTAGTAGSTGAKGATGPAGATGPEGEPGLDGKDGKNGATGPEGAPWTAGGTLPEGKTETGTWAIADGKPATVLFGSGSQTSISFTIPLGETLNEAHVHFIPFEGKGAGGGCPTESSASKPEAEPGNLCVFLSFGVNIDEGSVGLFNPEVLESGAGKVGSVLLMHTPPEKENESMQALGTWAVTAAVKP